MRILKFQEFLNEQSVYNVGVPLYRGNSFEAEKTIKRNALISELQDLLSQVASGALSELTVVAEIPTQGKNAPQYLKDIYSEMGYDPSKDRDMDEPSKNIFVDSEFLVKDVDQTRGVIMAVPYSLRGKGVMVEITPEMVEEAFIK
jgi:hypothetical protein